MNPVRHENDAGPVDRIRAELAETTFFQALPAAALARLAACAERRAVVPGAVLARAGAPSSSLYALVWGAVRIGAPDVPETAEGPGAVFGAGAVTGEVEAAGVEVLEPGDVLRWSAAALASLLDAEPALREQLATRLTLRRRRREIEELLHQSYLFRDTSPMLLRRLVELSTLARYATGAYLCRQGEPGDTLFVIVQGHVAIERENGGGARRVAVLGRGDSVGEISILSAGPRTTSAVAASDAEVLIVGRRAFEALAAQSRAFLRRVRAIAGERVELVRSDEARPPHPVWVSNGSAHPTQGLALLVAQALQAHLGAEAALLVLGRPGPATTTTTEGGVRRLEGPVDAAGGLVAEARARYVLVCVAPEIERQADQALGARLTTELRFLDRGPAPLHRAERFVHDVWVGGGRTERAAGDLRLPLDRRADLSAPDVGRVSAPVAAALGRIARALAHRRVGVALSGGGAWGYAHCVFLRRLVEAGIPIDVVAGSSFGSVVGAMYARHGLAGLDRLEAIHRKASVVVALSVVSSWAVERAIERWCGDAELAELDLPFLPVAVDVLTSRQTAFRSGPLASAVRASCAFPGVFGPALRDGRRYVDGAIADNVPVNVLRDEGADFVIASTIMPAPPPLEPDRHETRLGRVWAELSPIGRARDLLRSVLLLGHNVSRDLAARADVVFAPDLTPFLLHEWGKAPRIMELAQRQVVPAVATAVRLYEAL
jgi:NTE family protein